MAKQIPLAFAIMSRRKTADYEVVFAEIMKIMPDTLNLKEVNIDFETAIWRALRRVMPDVSVRGCAFHWSQAIYKRICDSGLRNAYQRNVGVRKFLRSVMALPNLPAEHIVRAFQELRTRCPVGEDYVASIQSLLAYLDKTWISSSSRPPLAWTTYQRVVRTNNDAEGWHNRLNANAVGSHSLNLYVLIGTLHDEASLRRPSNCSCQSYGSCTTIETSPDRSILSDVVDLVGA